MLVLSIFIVAAVFIFKTGKEATGVLSLVGTLLILGLQVYPIRGKDGEFLNVSGPVRRTVEGRSPEWNAARANRVNTIVDALNACAVLLLVAGLLAY
jgi:hypothetical protein